MSIFTLHDVKGIYHFAPGFTGIHFCQKPVTYEVFARSKFNKIINVICAAKAAWLYMVRFGIVFSDPKTSTLRDLIVPASIFVHNVIYIS